MASDKQIEANRRNAQRSTGPKTPEGKESVSQNAVTHALHATKIIIDSPHFKEDPAQYQTLLASLIADLRPGNAMQHHLVGKIANAMWRYRRVIRAETGMIMDQFRYLNDSDLTQLGDDPDLETPEGRESYAALLDQRRELFIDSHSLPPDVGTNKILRYERCLDRQITAAYRLLRHLQILEKAKSLPEECNENEK